MSRFLKIITLNLQQITEHRARSLVWFSLSMFNPLMMLIFWKGSFSVSGQSGQWNFGLALSYYLLYVVFNAALIAHVEDDVAGYDIQEGNLTKYLLRPYPYVFCKFAETLPYRVLQGVYGIISILLLSFFYGKEMVISHDIGIILLAVITMILAHFVSFFYKMCLGLVAFWFVDMRALYEITDIIEIVFAGYLMPLYLLPSLLQNVSYSLPFAYCIYFPVITMQGRLSYLEVLKVIGIQATWIALFVTLYLLLWKQGVKKYTAVGQ